METSALGQILRNARKARGLSVAKTSQLAGVSVATVKRWETGQGLPGRTELDAYLASIGAPWDSAFRIALRVAPPTKAEEIEQSSPLLRLIRAARRRNRITLEQVRDATGISLASLHRYETGERVPAPSILRELALACGCAPEDVDLLVGYVESGFPSNGGPARIVDAYENADHPHLRAFQNLAAFLHRSDDLPDDELARAVLYVFEGFTLMGDHHAIVEAWDSMKPKIERARWSDGQRATVRLSLLFARLNAAPDPLGIPLALSKLRRLGEEARHADQEFDILGRLLRIAFTLHDYGWARVLLDRVAAVAGAMKDPEVDAELELNRLAIACGESPDPKHIEALEDLRDQIGIPFRRYSLNVALASMFDRMEDKQGLQRAIELCRADEERYGLGSPLARRSARLLLD